LLAKLALRSHKWHRLKGGAHALHNYAGELGEKSNVATIRAAIGHLCGHFPLASAPWLVEKITPEEWGPRLAEERADAAKHFATPQKTKDVKLRMDSSPTFRMRRPAKRAKLTEPPDPASVVDLTYDEEEEESGSTSLIDELKYESSEEIKSELSDAANIHRSVVPSASTKAEPVGAPPSSLEASSASADEVAHFAASDSEASLADLLGILSNEELKALCKELKLRPNGTVSSIQVLIKIIADDTTVKRPH
jgi:hypothetical protein